MPSSRLGVHDGRDEAGADALDRVRARLAAGQDRRKRRLDREDLEVRPFLLEHLGAAGDVPAGADAGDQGVERMCRAKSRRISCAVVRRWTSRLAGFSNCCGIQRIRASRR